MLLQPVRCDVDELRSRAEDAGIVEERVKGAELRIDGLEQAHDLFGLAHVGLDGERFAAFLADVGDDAVSGGFVTRIVDRDVIAAPGRQPGRRCADAAAGAGDEHDFSHCKWSPEERLLLCKRSAPLRPAVVAAAASDRALLPAGYKRSAWARRGAAAVLPFGECAVEVATGGPVPRRIGVAQLRAYFRRPRQPRVAARAEMNAARRAGRGYLPLAAARFGGGRRGRQQGSNYRKTSQHRRAPSKITCPQRRG